MERDLEGKETMLGYRRLCAPRARVSPGRGEVYTSDQKTNIIARLPT
jgi:hypothetical protein